MFSSPNESGSSKFTEFRLFWIFQFNPFVIERKRHKLIDTEVFLKSPSHVRAGEGWKLRYSGTKKTLSVALFNS